MLTNCLIISTSSALLKFRKSWNMNRLSISGVNQLFPLSTTGGSAKAIILNEG